MRRLPTPSPADDRALDEWVRRRFGVPAAVLFKAGNFAVGVATGLILPWLVPAAPALQFGVMFACVAFCAMHAWGLTNGVAVKQISLGIRNHRQAWALYAALMAAAGAAVIFVVAVALHLIIPAFVS